MTLALRTILAGLALFAIAGCSDSQPSKAEGETGGTGYPADRVITGTVPGADQATDVDRNPAPQTSTGGEIPGGGAAGGDEGDIAPPRE